MIRRLAVCVLVAAGVMLATPTAVRAHASLRSSTPSPGDLLDATPKRIELMFTEAVDVVPDAIRVVGAEGSPVAIGDVEQALGADSLTADLPTLRSGTYVIVWKAVSADAHPISGAITFSVGERSETRAGLVDDLLDSTLR